jgi:hypothetical protein
MDVELPDKSEKEKCKALLYAIGQEGREIYHAFLLTKERETNSISSLRNLKISTFPKPM